MRPTTIPCREGDSNRSVNSTLPFLNQHHVKQGVLIIVINESGTVNCLVFPFIQHRQLRLRMLLTVTILNRWIISANQGSTVISFVRDNDVTSNPSVNLCLNFLNHLHHQERTQCNGKNRGRSRKCAGRRFRREGAVTDLRDGGSFRRIAALSTVSDENGEGREVGGPVGTPIDGEAANPDRHYDQPTDY